MNKNTEQPNSLDSKSGFVSDLNRLARFGANILDAYSCFILLPTSILAELAGDGAGSDEILKLVGCHSLSTSVIEGCSIKTELGLIGWVARNSRSIHVSPFERDSRILGVYRDDQSLKSFIGIPVPLEKKSNICGVVACDSKKAFAFSKLQGKLLEELGAEVGSIVDLHRRNQTGKSTSITWESFMARAQALADTIGYNEVSVLRVKAANYSDLEFKMGSGPAIKFIEQVFRLVGQGVAPHYPIYRSPMGELILVIDSMMSGVYENKLAAIAQHTAVNGLKVQLEFSSASFNARLDKVFMLEKLISSTAFDANKVEEHAPRKVLNFR